MTPETRRARLVALVQDRGRVSVEALAASLGTSRETIRRDLTELSDKGLIRKVHGGARVPEPAAESPFNTRLTQNTAAKRRIARAAAALFHPGDALFIDTGSTTVLFAEALVLRPGLTAITNAPAIAAALARGDAQIHLLGGSYRSEAAETLGPATIAQIANFAPRHAVLTIAGLDATGPMDADADEAAVARAMIARAAEVTLLVDSTKFDRSALHRLCPLGAVRRIVTDAAPPRTLTQAIRAAGVTLIVAPDN